MTHFDWSRRSAALAMDDLYAPVSEPLSALLSPETAALVKKYAASLLQLVNADGVAVGYGSRLSMICVASSGFSAPQLGSELLKHSAAREAIEHNRAVISPRTGAEASICAIQSCVAIPAPRESEASTLLVVYGPTGDTLGKSGVRMLEAAAEYLAFIITAAAPAPAPEVGLLEFVQASIELDCAPEASDEWIGQSNEGQSNEAGAQLPYFDAPTDFEAPAPPAVQVPQADVLADTLAWEQFDLLDEPARRSSSAGPADDPTADQKQHSEPIVAPLVPDEQIFTHVSQASSQRPVRAFAACVVLAVVAAVLFFAHRKAPLASRPLASSSQVSPANAAPIPVPTPSALSATALLSKSNMHSKRGSQTDDLSTLRSKALRGDAAVRVRLADALANSSDSAQQREAYAWYIVAGEMGSSSARRRAQELNSKIPRDKIGEVRERVAGVFEEPLSSTHDLTKAYEWYLLAANSGAKVQTQLDRLRRQMTPEELGLAESTAHEWLQRHWAMAEH